MTLRQELKLQAQSENSGSGYLQMGARSARAVLNPASYLSVVERAMLSRHEGPVGPQLFILGLPRSGTTLIYQYVVHRLAVSYFSNGVGRYPRSPCFTTMVQRLCHGDYHSDFQSNYGKVSGPMAPREAGSFWGRFFDPDNYVEYPSLSAPQIRILRKSVACVQAIFGGAPFANKNVKHLLRIAALARLFPESRFLFVERDRVNVALSLLRGRFETLEDASEWLSARPTDYDSLKNLPVIEQIAGQLNSLDRRARADLSQLDPNRILRISYEAFCDRPECLTEKLDSSFDRLPRRNPPVEGYDPTPRQIRNDAEASLVDLINKTESQSG